MDEYIKVILEVLVQEIKGLRAEVFFLKKDNERLREESKND